jgi:glycosyltransferase involved in cell wall biosynthesis
MILRHETIVSVVIPVYNSGAVISGCLQSLSCSDFPTDNYEIIVVDDGSSDDTYSIARKLSETSPARIGVLRQIHRGPAAARNTGIRNAGGRIVLFTGADCFAERGLLRNHVGAHELHKKENIAILGYTTWHPALKVSPFMRWLENSGMQFDYGRIGHGEEASYRHFYTSNISLKKNFMLKAGIFDESFVYAAFDDIELGYRLTSSGLKIIYNKTAIVYHLHPTDPLRYSHRQRMAGRSMVLFTRKHPSMASLEGRSRKMYAVLPEWSALFANAILCALDRLNVAMPAPFYSIPMTYYYWLGVTDVVRVTGTRTRRTRNLPPGLASLH